MDLKGIGILPDTVERLQVGSFVNYPGFRVDPSVRNGIYVRLMASL